MIQRLNAPAALLIGLGALTATLAGCANDGALGTTSNLTTAAVTPAAAPKVDPACVALAAQIDGLRQEGTIDRLQQAAEGKSASVQVKRTALAKQAELNKVNADFQAKCATITPKPVNAAAPAPVAKAAAAAAPAAAPAAKKVVKKVTAAAPVATPAAVQTSVAPVPAAEVVPTAAPRAPDVVVSVPVPKE